MYSSHHVSVFLMLFLAFIIMVVRVDGKQRTFELNISKGSWPMNCNEQQQGEQVMMINGQHPGPAIRATLNDDIHVVVRNHAEEPTTVHYHGILQIGTTESDGMPNITQREIQPGGEFHAHFRLIGQTGTFFYHAHVALQDDSVQGPFIVYPTEDAWPANVNGEELEKRDGNDDHGGSKLVDGPYHYDDERIVQLSEYWAQNPHDRLDYYLGAEYKGFIPADQYLINGHAGSASAPAPVSGKQKQQAACPGMSAVEVAHGKVYRVRVIGALSFATLGFSVAKHKMTIIEMDGTLIEPYETDYLEVSSGQRYSVLLEANQAPGSSFNMDVLPFWITNTTVSGRAILSYQGHSKEQDKNSRLDLAKNCPKEFALTTQHAASDSTKPQFPEPVNQWIFPSVKPLHEENLDFNAKPDRTIVLMPKEHLIGKKNTTRWLINGRHMPVHHTPLLEQLKQDFHSGHHERRSIMRRGMNATAMKLNKAGSWDGFDEDLETYPMRHGEVVDVVIHTTTLINHGICAGHPWHSHGFVHYPIAHGMGEYHHETDQDLRTYEHPVAKDTTFVYPGTTALASEAGIPCGWTKVRIYANNPGLWAFHCHITGHMLQGMMVIVEMATDQIKYLQQ
ncbi:unnamed protein product [Absidia cylindrospora]